MVDRKHAYISKTVKHTTELKRFASSSDTIEGFRAHKRNGKRKNKSKFETPPQDPCEKQKI